MSPTGFSDLTQLYDTMDLAYDKVAGRYGFHCSGCEDNCCRSLFFHHTHIEKAYLLHGFKRLPPEQQKRARKKAGDYIKATFTGKLEPESLKLMCPLNEKGLCILYGFRPMICRLHGLPHELKRPGATVLKGPGCQAGNFGGKPYIPFDRTPHYMAMARLEKQFRQLFRKTGKIKETIAQMLV